MAIITLYKVYRASRNLMCFIGKDKIKFVSCGKKSINASLKGSKKNKKKKT